MGTVTGVIDFLETKDQNQYGKHTIRVNGQYYRSKFPAKGQVGDTVEFDDMGKKWINQLKIVSAGGSGGAPVQTSSRAPAFPVGFDTMDRRYVRQDSLTHAKTLVIEMMQKIMGNDPKFQSFDDVKLGAQTWAELMVDIARIFEDYSAGDADYRAVKETMTNDE